MSQVNPIQHGRPVPLTPGENVRCELYPEMTLKIVSISGKLATVRTPKGNLREVGLHRLSRA